jgi:hypothetical protein
LSSWANDFNKGTSLTIGTEHAISSLDELQKELDNFHLGNTTTENLYDHLFGKDAYSKKLKSMPGASASEIKESLTADVTRIKNLLKDDGLQGLREIYASEGLSGLTSSDNGKNEFNWDLSKYNSTKEVIKEVTD